MNDYSSGYKDNVCAISEPRLTPSEEMDLLLSFVEHNGNMKKVREDLNKNKHQKEC